MSSPTAEALPGSNHNLTSLVEDYERKLIQLALDAAGGHQRRAAASLGIRATTLSEKLRRLGLRRRGTRPGPAVATAASEGGCHT